MAQVPRSVMCTFQFPLASLVAVQGPVAVKVTGLPERPPVALTWKSGAPRILLARVPKLIVWLALLSATVSVAESLLKKLLLSALVAVTWQVPEALVTVSWAPLTAQPVESPAL